MEEADVQPAARILNEGHFYFADQELRNALAAVKAVDPHAAGALFERWRDDGRIRPDLDADRRHHIEPATVQSMPDAQVRHKPAATPIEDRRDEQATRQGHRR